MSNYGAEFGERLKNERLKMGMNQAQFAAVGGVAKLTQLKYEKGARVPSVEYLYGIYQQGADVGYLLTGKRASGLMPSAPEWARNMSDKQKAFATGIVDHNDLERVIEAVEAGLQAKGAAWSAKKKAGLIASLYAVSRILPWAEDDTPYAQTAEMLIQSWGLEDKGA